MQREHDLAVLQQLRLFRGLAPSDLADIARSLRPAAFKAGATIIRAEEQGQLAFLITSGTVKVHMLQADGREVMIDLLCAGQLIGEMSLLDAAPSSAFVTAIEPCTALAFDRVALHDWLERFPRLGQNLAIILAGRLRHANLRLQSYLTLDLRRRVACRLALMAQDCGRAMATGAIEMPFRLTQGDLAELVGASRYRVNQVLVGFKRDGLIAETRGHQLTILAPQRLEQLAAAADLSYAA